MAFAKRDMPVSAEKRQRAVVVLGAGRSGTSAITRALAAIGVELGPKLRRGRGKNPTGFFEDTDLLRLNKRLKRLLRVRGTSVRLIADEEWRRPDIQALEAEAARTIRTRFGDSPLWGYKYGRTLRFLPFWEAVYRRAGLDVSYVVAVRNPLSVARSRGKLDPRRGAQEKSDLEWLVNVVPYFGRLRGKSFVVADYDGVMEAPADELRRIAGGLGIPATDETEAGIESYAGTFLRQDMRHTRFTREDLERDASVNRLVREAYGWLDRLAKDECRADDPELWRDWARIAGEVQALSGVLAHIDRVEAELERARWNPLTPFHALWRAFRSLRTG